MNQWLKSSAVSAAVLLSLGATSPTLAQWSIGAPGAHEAPAGQQRYYMLVFANALPGRDVEFNDWYLNTHLGDLVQLEGWNGAQRFRLAPLSKQLTPRGYTYDYAVLWDQQGPEIGPVRQRMIDAIRGGKSRRGAGFPYDAGGGGGASSATYKMTGPRVFRPDGVRASMPRADDNKTARPNRYMMMEFVSAPPGTAQAAFDAAIDARIRQVLTVKGWMAAQRLQLDAPPSAAEGDYPRNLIIWEVEAENPQVAQTALDAAVAAGGVGAPLGAPQGAMRSYWEPISPYVTKADFDH